MAASGESNIPPNFGSPYPFSIRPSLWHCLQNTDDLTVCALPSNGDRKNSPIGLISQHSLHIVELMGAEQASLAERPSRTKG